MSKHNVVEFKDRESITEPLTQMLSAGAQKLIHQAVELELQNFLDQYAERIVILTRVSRQWCAMAICRRVSYKQD